MIPATHHRLLTRGDLPDSMGGLYNPGAWYGPDGLTMTVRHEPDYSWTQPCRATIATIDPHTRRFLGATTIPFLGFDAGTRFEDLRPFVWRDEVLISHVAYQPGSGRPVRQRLSKLRPDWSAIERWDDWHLPTGLNDVEKNWALVSHAEGLACVYSLSPLWVYLKTERGWPLFGDGHNDWAAKLGHQPRCSTHLLPWRDGYLGFWHCRIDGVYVHGAYWMDQSLRLRRRSGILLDGQDVQYRASTSLPDLARPEEIYKPGVLYLSSWVDRGEDLWLFYGEGDAHSGVAIVKADDVDRRLR